MERNTETILQKISRLQRIVRDYSEGKDQSKSAPQKNKSSKNNRSHSQKSKSSSSPSKHRKENTRKSQNKPAKQDKQLKNDKSQKSRNEQKPKTENFHGIEVPEELYDRCLTVYTSAKNLRRLRNQNLTRHYLDLWLTALLRRLMSKENIDTENANEMHSSGFQSESESNSHFTTDGLNTDELINDPDIKVVEELQRSLLEEGSGFDELDL
ncbi:hypothetical protein TRFO_22256 [Tritrichomonas foetus]|uniref:Uncharacterized protein n=1 Tax=Tritrichomonas foetus TaxID=1144522 RepID=A0A1J4KDF3_9EUKA|nr:hypothetical protein TRFO_22256 [Tritrichomonas foetus]|eukprot:OHT09010.1 hypothetical protein TRFO_22256 [Tritrichomonas foetus]